MSRALPSVINFGHPSSRSLVLLALFILVSNIFPQALSEAFVVPTSLTMSSSDSDSSTERNVDEYRIGKLKKIKQREAELANLLTAIRQEKLATLRSRPLTIGVVGFGRFGQFIARSFAKHSGRVVVTSRSDYTDIANGMGVKYIPLSDPKAFLDQNLDVIVMATSILSFDDTIATFSRHLKEKVEKDDNLPGPLIVDVLSVKEHPREVLLEMLPTQCDILCTHPMFGPDSGKNGWHGLTFVYERTRINGVILDPDTQAEHNLHQLSESTIDPLAADNSFLDAEGTRHTLHEGNDAFAEGMDRMERFLSIWEEEGCRMVPMSCKDHDSFAANSQFITHLMGRILGTQGLKRTPIDTKGFESVLKLIGTTTADSFDLFYGLFKYNRNSMDTIIKLKESMDDVVTELKKMEKEQDEQRKKRKMRVLPLAKPVATVSSNVRMETESEDPATVLVG